MREESIGGIHVREQGSGLPVVLVHAFPVDGRMYQPLLRSDMDAVRLIVPDLPGFGSTDPTKITSLDDYADAVLSVCDREGIDRFVCGGTSMGGYVAFAVWRKAADRLAGLVLADTRATPDDADGKRNREETARRVETEGTSFLADELIPRLLGPGGRDGVEQAARAMASEASTVGVAAALRAMAGRADSTPLLAEIAIPTLVVVGEHDEITPPDVARDMAEALPDSRLEVIGDAGHLAPLEAPGEFADMLTAFTRDL